MCKMPDHIKRSLNMILMLDKKVSSRLHSYLEAASKRSPYCRPEAKTYGNFGLHTAFGSGNRVADLHSPVALLGNSARP